MSKDDGEVFELDLWGEDAGEAVGEALPPHLFLSTPSPSPEGEQARGSERAPQRAPSEREGAGRAGQVESAPQSSPERHSATGSLSRHTRGRKAGREQGEAPKPSPLRLRVSAGELLGEAWWTKGEPPKTPALLETARGELWLPAGRLGVLAAPGGTGKTTLLISLAVAVASGWDWLGLRVAQRGRVLLVLGEETREEVARRMWIACNYGGQAAGQGADRWAALSLGLVDVLALSGQTATLVDAAGERTSFAGDLAALVAQQGYKLVVVDPLSRANGGDENDNATVTRLVECLEALAESGATVLVAHHTAKAVVREGRDDSSQADARGAGALVDGARWAASLRRVAPSWGAGESPAWEGERVQLAVTKTNYGPRPEPLELFWPRGESTYRVATAAEVDRWRAAKQAADVPSKGRPKGQRKPDKKPSSWEDN